MPKPSSLRLVWLEAFIAVADGGTQGAAARELGLDQPTVSRYVGALEAWLGRVLLDPAVPGQLWPDGEEFLLTAIEVLTMLKEAREARWEKLGTLRIEWLEAFVALAEYRKQAAAAASLGIKQPMISRYLKSLTTWLGAPELVDTNVPLNLSPAGQRFLPVAQEVLKRLSEAKASLPPVA